MTYVGLSVFFNKIFQFKATTIGMILALPFVFLIDRLCYKYFKNKY